MIRKKIHGHLLQQCAPTVVVSVLELFHFMMLISLKMLTSLILKKLNLHNNNKDVFTYTRVVIVIVLQLEVFSSFKVNCLLNAFIYL